MKLLLCTQIVDKNHSILGFFHGWILEFAKHFDEVHIICLQKGTYNLPDHVHVYSLGKEEGKNKFKYVYRFYKYFWHIFVNVKVDYVFLHMGAIMNILAAPFYILAKMKRIPFYWWKTHGHIDLVGRVALLFVDRVYTAVEESFPVRTSKRQVVGHAINANLFTMRDSLPEKPTLLFVGRLSRIKRVEQVLAVAKILHDRGYGLSVRIIGEPVDAKYYQELLAEQKKYGLESIVTFVGNKQHEQLVAEYHHASVFMNPSDNDGMDKVILEAMACGVIPVTGNASFVRMLSPHKLSVEKGDIEQYANTIESILNLGADTYFQRAAALRDIVVKEHALETLPKRLFGVES